jgi:hypothetical protein
MTIRQMARRVSAATSRRATRVLAGTFNSVTRRYAVLNAYVTRHNAGIVTAGQYLTEVLKAGADFAASFDSPFGKAIKKAYKELHGADPAKMRLVTEHRRLHRAIGYRLGEPALAVATRTYPRTAALIGAS